MQDYKKGLNEQQLEAVNTIYGPLLIIAGAGTGKTKTIICPDGKFNRAWDSAAADRYADIHE